MVRTIQVARNEELLTKEYVFKLAQAMVALDLPRRAVPDWLAETLFSWVMNGGVILDGNGLEIVIRDDTIDKAHGNDGSFHWISALRQRVSNPQQRNPRRSLLLRFQLYDAAFRIAGRPIFLVDSSSTITSR